MNSKFVISTKNLPFTEWLERIFNEIPTPIGIKLKIYSATSRPKSKLITIIIPTLPSVTLSVTEVISRLHKSNPKLNVACWRLYHLTKDSPTKVRYRLGIDEASLQYIKSNNFKLFYGLGCIHVFSSGNKAASVAVMASSK